jgi:urocanate hydratase
MEEDQTLLIQSGKPIGLVRTHAKAPLVIMANCNIVGQWAKAEVFYELQRKGLICWGGLTAGAWQYIGSQGVIQGTYEIFMRIAERRFGGDLLGRFVLTAGLAAWAGRSRSPAAWRGLRSSASTSTRNGPASASRSVISRKSRPISILPFR